jgi:hypothetical protein
VPEEFVIEKEVCGEPCDRRAFGIQDYFAERIWRAWANHPLRKLVAIGTALRKIVKPVREEVCRGVPPRDKEVTHLGGDASEMREHVDLLTTIPENWELGRIDFCQAGNGYPTAQAEYSGYLQDRPYTTPDAWRYRLNEPGTALERLIGSRR